MSPELERKLAEKYTFMRKGKSLSQQFAEGGINDLYSAFGCECGDGWFDLIDELCMSIQNVYEKYGIPVDIEVDQVKEKYGSLRFYATAKGPEHVQAEVDRLIRQAEDKSESICEECGKPGILRDGDWISVRCDGCYAKEHSR